MNEPQQLAFFGPSQAAQPWPPGHRIGPFELQAVVARGPSGLVYRAWDHALARPAAVKEYLPAAWARRDESGAVHPAAPAAAAVFERGRQAFVAEARRLALCDTPSLVRVLHLVEAHGTAYRVMPWYTGQVLSDVRRTMAGPPDEGALRSLLGDLLDAVEAFQRAGGPHGGVGPGQVMLLEDDRALLLGSGAATRALQPGGGAADTPGGDLRALADLALFCITGRANEPAGEPAAALIEHRFGSQRGARFSEGLLATLDAARIEQPGQLPLTPASFRARLITTPPPPPPAAPEVDPATADLIRRVVAAVPPAPAAPKPPAPEAELPPILGPGPRSYPPLRPRRRAWPWGALAVGALGLGGLAIWALPFLPPLDTPPEPATAVLPPAPTPVAPPVPAPVAPPAPAPVVPPAPAAVAPAAVAPAAPAPAPAPVPAPPPPPPPAPPPEPVVVTPKAPARAAPAAPARARVDSPREACGNRTPFSLYRCMQQQCAQPRWTAHAQCVRLRATDRVD